MCCRWWPKYYFLYCPSSRKCTITVVYNPRNYFQSQPFKNITYVKYTSLLHWRTMSVVAKLPKLETTHLWNYDRQRWNSNDKFVIFYNDEIDKRLAKWLRQWSTTRNCKICAQIVYIAISGCRSLSQSHGVSFFELDVVEPPDLPLELSSYLS